MSNLTAWELVEPARQEFVGALTIPQPEREAAFIRESNFAVQVLSNNEYALKIARGNPGSVISAVSNVAAIGISLNPAKKQAYLVPRDGRICLDISYFGLIDLATESGSTRWVQCQVVRASDTFSVGRIDEPPSHGYSPFSNRGDVVGVYCVAKTNDGDYLTHCMSIQDALKIRDRSAAYKKNKSGPWVTDEVEMIRKTCVKQASKYWPRDKQDDRLAKAIDHLNREAGEGLDASDLASNTTDQANQNTNASKTLPPYPESRLELKLPAWREAAKNGNDPEVIVSFLQSKYTLSPEQLQTIRNLKENP
jgi:recombination protein RecT